MLQRFTARRNSNPAERGFTIIELMIVITIIMILMTIAAGRYTQSLLRAREAALHQDLFVMRQAIDSYTLDKKQPPQSLDDLTQGVGGSSGAASGYLREVPLDPMTHEKDWSTDTCDTILSPEQLSGGGICDVHSRSGAISPFENTAYSSW
jgi:general secretion pathway protein G